MLSYYKVQCFSRSAFCDYATCVSSCKHILGVQIRVNMYFFLYTYQNDGFKIFSTIEGTCVATTNLDVTNEENMEDALSRESSK